MGAAPFKGLWQNQLQNVANPHNALVLANPNQTNYHSALELAAAQLNIELSSFKETFPMLKDGDPIVIIPIQYLDKLNNFIKDQISDVLASTIKKLDFNPSEAFSIFNRNLKSNNTFLFYIVSNNEELILLILINYYLSFNYYLNFYNLTF